VEQPQAAPEQSVVEMEQLQTALEQPVVEVDPSSTEPASTIERCPSPNMEQPQAAPEQSEVEMEQLQTALEQPVVEVDPSSTEPASTIERCPSPNMEQPQAAPEQSEVEMEQLQTALEQPVVEVDPSSTEPASTIERCPSPNMEQPQAAPEQSVVEIEPTVDTAPGSSTCSLVENQSDEPVSVGRGRKRTRSIENWQKSLRKKRRNLGDEYVTDRGVTKARRKIKKGCGVGCRLQCHRKILPAEREKLFHAFWQLGDVTRQREFVVKHCSKVPAGSRKVLTASRRKFTLNYSFELNSKAVIVCKQFFLDTLAINDRVIRTAFEKVTECGTVNGDNRGAVRGRSNICADAKQRVVDHINRFPRVESHYCRASSSRQYLESGLSLSQMYRLYVEEMAAIGQMTVKEHMYRKIFNENFNLSFFTPKKDQCDTCFAYANSSDLVRRENESEFHSHIQRKEKARQKKNEMKCAAKQDNTMTAACFDLQQVLPSPHGQISVYYYKRKLSTYNFTCYDLGTGRADCFMWNESYAGRGSNEINSCLFQYLKLNSDKQFICTFSDNCAGQNKSKYTVVTFLKALAETNINAIEHYYLEKGHTQNENDSVHSTVERAARKIPIYTPDQWCSVVRGAKKIGEPYVVHEMVPGSFSDFKALTDSYRNFTVNTCGEKVNWLKICRLRFVKSEPHTVLYAYSYDGDHMQLDLLQKHRGTMPDIREIKLATLPSSSSVSKAKHSDLMSLCSDKHNLIPEQYHTFYRNLNYNAAIADAGNK